MAPSSSQEPPAAPRRYCAMAPHLLKVPNRSITDVKLLNFARKINSEMRLGNLMCLGCYKNLQKLYRMKMANARMHQQKRAESSGNSMSDVSSSQRMGSTSASSPAPPTGVTIRRKQPAVLPSSQSSSTSNDATPTTSTAAAAKTQRTSAVAPPPPPPRNTSYVSDDDDPNSNLSLNAVNGTRLPHIQPIPKRHQFVHMNKTAMDIYLAGTTGG